MIRQILIGVLTVLALAITAGALLESHFDTDLPNANWMHVDLAGATVSILFLNADDASSLDSVKTVQHRYFPKRRGWDMLYDSYQVTRLCEQLPRSAYLFHVVMPKLKPRTGVQHAYIHFPLWVPLVTFSAYPVIALIGVPLRRNRRRKRGCCIHCGYDLTGNVSGVCSECGKPA